MKLECALECGPKGIVTISEGALGEGEKGCRRK